MELTRKMINGSQMSAYRLVEISRSTRGGRNTKIVLLRQHPHPRFISSTLTSNRYKTNIQTLVNCKQGAELN